jgi:hypothetical protein
MPGWTVSTMPLKTIVSTSRVRSASKSSWTVRSATCVITSVYRRWVSSADRAVTCTSSRAFTYRYSRILGTTSTVGSRYSTTISRDSGTYASRYRCGKSSG